VAHDEFIKLSNVQHPARGRIEVRFAGGFGHQSCGVWHHSHRRDEKCRERGVGFVQGVNAASRPPNTKENTTMAKYLLLKHYRGAPAPANDVPMDQWTPEEVEAHIGFMRDFAARLESTGEFVDAQALSPDGVWVQYDGEGRPPVTDGPFAETKDLIAGWMVIDVDTHERALELAAELPTVAD
jgi:hypothetical protein